MLCIKVIDKNGLTINVRRDENEVHLSLFHEYQEGDQIIIEVSDTPVFAWLQLDDALGRSLVYLTGDLWYKIPFGEKRINLSPKAFAGGRHLLTLKKAHDFEVNTYRNLAFNVNDCHENSTCFPHASANVETRGEAVFAAKNAIDGVTAATCHGEWPYASWGINRDPNAALTLDFGRDVTIDRIVIYLRADFPHDNWWKNALLTFSDGSDMELTFTKTGTAQEFTFEPKTIRKLEFSHLIKAETESPFPALTQIEVYGTEAQN